MRLWASGGLRCSRSWLVWGKALRAREHEYDKPDWGLVNCRNNAGRVCVIVSASGSGWIFDDFDRALPHYLPRCSTTQVDLPTYASVAPTTDHLGLRPWVTCNSNSSQSEHIPLLNVFGSENTKENGPNIAGPDLLLSLSPTRWR
ncbi:hypothetical protein B0T10DRAFT_452718 [Thelonectria olida]|uniref:Uncharacterized protein n=1 Tax=Thelonectria olida TaxID=1576542 RepID=A0A9P8WGC2_9HYPO|nr:hypothetical protein B0T10DRAFT_452718 [Thelonectria olida]